MRKRGLTPFLTGYTLFFCCLILIYSTLYRILPVCTRKQLAERVGFEPT